MNPQNRQKAMPLIATGLLERERELDALDRAVADAADGEGRLVVIEAPAGLGKTCLAEAAAEAAERNGLRALRARGSELERDFAFGCVRQWLEPVVQSTDAASPSLFAGAARLAWPLFETHADGRAPPPSGDATFRLLRGLYWLCANLAGERPLLLSLDDAHWTDTRTLRFLAFLAVRLDGLPAVVMLTTRPGEPGERGALLARLAQNPLADVLSPAPLSREAAGVLVARAFAGDSDPAFTDACHRATNGNPLYLSALLNQARQDRASPTADQAQRVSQLGPKAVFRAVLLHLGSAPAAAFQLARILCVLGDGAGLAEAAALAGMSERRAGEAADALVGRSLLRRDERLSFAHPVVRETIYAEMPPHEREALHARAAEVLHDLGASGERVAAHLLRSEPRGSVRAVEILRGAAKACLARGAPDIAAVHLKRALREPPPPQERAEMIWELGRALFHAGEREGVERLREALGLVDGRRSALIARELAHALVPLELNEEAVAALEHAIGELGDDDWELALQLEAEMASAGRLHPATCERTGRRIRRHIGIGGDSPAERAVLTSLAMERLLSGAPVAEAAALAMRALDGGLLAEQGVGSVIFYDAPYVLIVSDRLDLAARVCEEALADARRRGSQFGFALASSFRADVAYRWGSVANAEAEARASMAAASEAGWHIADYALAFLIDALIELDRLDEAETALKRGGHDVFIPATFMHGRLLLSRARLRLARGQRDAGLADLEELGRRELRWRARCPAALPYRSTAAMALAERGERDDAVALAAEELELARRFGVPRAIGIALRALGRASGGERGIELLQQSVTELEGSPAPLEHARSLVEVGATLRRGNQRAEGRHALTRGLEFARRCGSSGLAQRAEAELRASGVRPPAELRSGPDELTPSERRVCELAAEGLSNPEIAQALFVTRKTVETHLGRAYRKLGISGRGKLSRTLSRRSPATA